MFEKVKKFYKEHKTEIIAVGFGLGSGILIGLGIHAIYHRGYLEGQCAEFDEAYKCTQALKDGDFFHWTHPTNPNGVSYIAMSNQSWEDLKNRANIKVFGEDSP